MEKQNIFAKLKVLLKMYEANLNVLHDNPENYYLNTPISDSNKKSEFFGAVQMKKSYVAFHLMPIYYFPDLLESISPELKNRMQGKSCFNFKTLDDKLLDELSIITSKAFDHYKMLRKI